MKNHRRLDLSASTLTESCVNSIYRQDIKQINHGCPGYTVHIPPLPSGFALVLGVVYERYIQDNHGLSITYTKVPSRIQWQIILTQHIQLSTKCNAVLVVLLSVILPVHSLWILPPSYQHRLQQLLVRSHAFSRLLISFALQIRANFSNSHVQYSCLQFH